MSMKSDRPVRLEKKIPLKEQLKNYFRKIRPYLLIFLIMVAFFIFFGLIFLYFPGTESGQYYNRGFTNV